MPKLRPNRTGGCVPRRIFGPPRMEHQSADSERGGIAEIGGPAMTREEAIKSLQNIIEYWTYKPTEVEAAKMAIAALRPVSREQVERVWPGCNRCKDPDTAIAWERWGHQYCSQCGRPLTPEAWEELRKRLEALNNDKK